MAPVTYGDQIRANVAADPERPVLRVARLGGEIEEYTWPQLHERSDLLARGLAGLGVATGSFVAVQLVNSLDFVAAVLAAWKLGAIPVPVRWDIPDWERDRVLAVMEPAFVATGESVPELEAAAKGVSTFEEGSGPHSHGICSSGSTGTPKVILADRPGVFDPDWSQPFPLPWGPVEPHQIVLVPAPMYHTNGFATLTSLLAGEQLIVMERFDAALVLDLVERYRVTTFTATPTMLARIDRLPDVDERDLSSIRWVLQGAAHLPPALARRWMARIGPEKFFMAYGMTEVLGLTALRGDEWLAHPGSVGRGIRETEVRILDGQRQPLPAGEVGEIWLRSPQGGGHAYLGAEPVPVTDDEFRTVGDLGWLDDDGYLYVADRRADLIVTGGANVYPAEVESALSEHPAIADIVIVGLPDDEWGRRVHAIVEPVDAAAPPSDDEVIAFAKERLAHYKAPKTVELVAQIPRTAATKVSRSALVAERVQRS